MKPIHFAVILSSLACLSATAAGTEAAADQPHEFTIPLDRQQMIGVTYATAKAGPLRRTLRAVGLVAATTGRRWDYVTRVDGYVHNLMSAPRGTGWRRARS